MLIKLVVALLVSILLSLVAAKDVNFTYYGFPSANLSLDGWHGIAEFTPNGLLMLTNATTVQEVGHAFYPNPISFKNSSKDSALSFSTTFVFAIVSEYLPVGGHGICFVITPTRGLPGGQANAYLGLFNLTSNGNSTNHVFAVELDTNLSPEFNEANGNHVGIDINSLTSEETTPAGYYVDKKGVFRELSLMSGHPMQVWVEYDGVEKQINVTLAPINVGKPNNPLLSLYHDLSPIIKETMYVGFSSSTGSVPTSHYILGWSFNTNGKAKEFNLSQLPKLPRGPMPKSKLLTILLHVISIVLVLVVVSGIVYYIRRKRKFAEVLEDWELDYGPHSHRYRFKELYIATQGFKDKELLGVGGFGKVYKGVLPASKVEIAVKRVSHDSRQGMKEFVAEIASIGRLRHRNLVKLLGYCRRKGELLLVYEYMANGSLEKFLYDQPKLTLNWSQRFGVIKGVASALFYLHEGWDQVVIHRDVKASNVLLDGELNGRLGDFGLARLCDHGKDPKTTRVVGTLGYLAPEHARTGKATPSTDMYAFGAFLLEVACGRRPVERTALTEYVNIFDWVFSCWSRGNILEAVDQNLGNDYIAEEVKLVMELGLLCSNSEPLARPTIRQVVQYLEANVHLPNMSSLGISALGHTFAHPEGFDGFSSSVLKETFPHSFYDSKSLG